MTSIRAKPNISMRKLSGSTTTFPTSAICPGPAAWRNSSGSATSSTPPSTTPPMLPMPPSTTMHSTMMDSMRLKLSGLTKPWKPANRPPEMPPKVAPMAKASSLMLRVLMPIAEAATSSSRIATQGRREEDHQQGEGEEQVVMQVSIVHAHAEPFVRIAEGEAADLQRVDAGDALRAVGDIDRGVQGGADNAD